MNKATRRRVRVCGLRTYYLFFLKGTTEGKVNIQELAHWKDFFSCTLIKHRSSLEPLSSGINMTTLHKTSSLYYMFMQLSS